MNKLLKSVLILLFLVSCKETNKSKAMESVIDEVIGKNVDIDEKYNLLLKELGTKTLLTDEQLFEAYPKKLGGLNIDSEEDIIKSSKSVIGSFGDGTIRMEILDAAGANAYGAIIPLKMLHLNKITSEYNNTIRYTKKERNGILTFGTDRDKDTKADFQSELRFLYDNRFYVTIEGKEMDNDALWGILDAENSLKPFKKLNH
jgi:hypothetical protein